MKSIYLPVVLVLCLTAWLLTACSKTEPVGPPKPPEVLVIAVPVADVPVFTEAIATLDGSTNTEIHSQVAGYLIKQPYEEGSVVKAGDLLFEIDPKPFQADLNKANATLANKQAQELRTKQDLDRYVLLVKSGAVSQQEYQTQVQNNLAAQADVNAAQASVDMAKINLGHTRITSPIDGVVGKAIPGVGDLISASMTLTTVSIVNPILADFTLSEQFYLDNAEKLAAISAMPVADRPERIQLILADGSEYPLKGKFYYINRQIQTATGAITAYALFPNPDRVLRPGQYVKVRAITQNLTKAVLIPQRCVSQLQGINQVMVVKSDNTVEIRSVTLGYLAGSDWVVTDGLQVGERVVVEGIQKCTQGGLVTPKPYVESPSKEPRVAPTTNARPAMPPVNP